jgi:hypothetical protein
LLSAVNGDEKGLALILANTKRHRLSAHQAAVAFRAAHILASLGIREDVARRLAIALAYATIRHDEGKVEASTQYYFMWKIGTEEVYAEYTETSAEADRGEVGDFEGPYHEEISLLRMTTRPIEFSRNVDVLDSEAELAKYGVRWHHRAHAKQDKKSYKYILARESVYEIEAHLRENMGKLGEVDAEMDAFNDLADKILRQSSLEFMGLCSPLVGSPDSDVFTFFMEAVKKIENSLSEGGDKPRLNSLNAVPSYQFVGGGHSNLQDNLRRGGERKLLMFILIAADRWASSLSLQELEDAMKNPLSPIWKASLGDELSTGRWQRMVSDNSGQYSNGSERAAAHVRATSSAAESHFTVLEGNMGVGKCSMALLWAAMGKIPRRLTFALPMQQHVANVFATAIPSPNHENEKLSDMERLVGSRLNDPDFLLTAEAIYGGERQSFYGPEESKDAYRLMSADISFVTWDRLLSPQYERGQFDEFLSLITSDLVLDELQDMISIPKIFFAIGELLHMRRILKKGGRTLLMTATHPTVIYKHFGMGVFATDKSGKTIFKYDPFVKFIGRHELEEPHDEEFSASFLELGDFKWEASAIENIEKRASEHGVHIKLDDLMLSTNKIRNARRSAMKLLPDKVAAGKFTMIAHSETTPKDKKVIVKAATGHFGGVEDVEGILFSSLMMIASHQLNFKYLIRSVGLPFMDSQSIGRLMRFKGKDGGVALFVNSANDSNMFRKGSFGYKELHERWKNFIKEELGTKDDVKLSRMKFMGLYDKFFEQRGSIEAFERGFLDQIEDVEKILANWFPMKLTALKKSKPRNGQNDGFGQNSNKGFREGSFVATAAAFDIFGEAAGDDGHVPKDDLLSADLRKGTALKSALKDKKARAILIKNLEKTDFEISPYGNIGTWPEAPLAYSSINKKTGRLDSRLSKLIRASATSSNVSLDENLIYLTGVGLMPITEFQTWMDSFSKVDKTVVEEYQTKIRAWHWSKKD